jgi:hypothetical protein
MPKAARIMPDQPFLRECFAYSPGSGTLTWRKRPRHHFVDDRAWRIWNTRFAGHAAGWVHNHGYIALNISGVAYLAHRLIWKLVTGKEPTEIDHKDNNPANNRWRNLRQATHQQNTWNSRGQTNHAKGIYYRPHMQQWRAEIRINGKTVGLGYFATEQEANAAYFTAAKKHFGEFANQG